MEPNRIPWNTHGTPWNPIEYHGTPWNPIEYHRTIEPQNTIEYHRTQSNTKYLIIITSYSVLHTTYNVISTSYHPGFISHPIISYQLETDRIPYGSITKFFQHIH